MKKRITIKEIAEIAGVNISTVSRVLNPDSGGRVGREQREKIIAICDKLNYRPRVAAKGCAQNKTFKIGLILGAIERDLCNSSFALYIRGVCSILQKHGYNLAILWVGETQYTQAEEVKNFLMSDTADGYILGAPLLEEQTLDAFRNSGRPILSFNNNWEGFFPGFMSVETDQNPAASRIWKAMPQELYSQVLFFGPEGDNTLFKAAAIEKYIPSGIFLEKLLFPLEHPRQSEFYAYWLARNNIAANWEKVIRKKVIWCSSDMSAFGVCDELQSRGIQVGKDIFVIGYGNTEKKCPFPGTEPYLSTIEPLWEEAGYTSANLILDAIKNPSDDLPHKKIESSYICRKSFPFDVQLK